MRGTGQSDPDIAIHQPQRVVIAGDDDGPPRIPRLRGIDPAMALQDGLQTPVQSYHAIRTAARGTQQLKTTVRRKHPKSPVGPCRRVGAQLGAFRSHDVEIASQPLWPLAVVPGPQHHVIQPRVFQGGDMLLNQVCMAFGQHLLNGALIACVDSSGQLTDATAGVKPVAVAQHHDVLIQGTTVWVLQVQGNRLIGEVVQALRDVGSVVP